ncbi:transporter [Salix suchowensis]|nr:transporter [Salix suchowensis]
MVVRNEATLVDDWNAKSGKDLRSLCTMAPHFDSTKVDLKPRRHHGYAVVLFIFGTLFPHLWAQRYGLVDTSEIKRKERKSQWANRYNDRLPESTYEGQPLEEGEVAGSSTSLPADSQRQPGKRQANGDLWRPEDESYYNAEQDNNSTRSSGRWHFPANFDDAIADEPIKKNKKKKKDKKDRWARTEDAYSLSEQTSKRKKSKKRSSAVGDGATSTYSNNSTAEFPEDPEGGLYAPRPDRGKDTTSPKENGQATDDTLFTHQF